MKTEIQLCEKLKFTFGTKYIYICCTKYISYVYESRENYMRKMRKLRIFSELCVYTYNYKCVLWQCELVISPKI